ncbi:MAG: tetratricopeptide repeat protein [Ignavibacteria bacterium]|nr:tetratricopeptide repeat protein [Ignavibacteria bacterium]MBI3766037.1 tetratricopeptide repeat protein [Ignavibacteriales bacterium]
MKHSTLFILIALFVFGLVSTGFQCSSSDVTSAKLYESRQDWENAEKSYAKEVEKNPNNGEAWYLLGRVRAQRANYKGMLEAFNKSLAATNQFQEDINTAKKFAWGQSINGAVAQYNKSITASKDSASLLRQQAITNYLLAIEIIPESTVAYQNLAIAQHLEKQYDAEIATLKEVLKRKPTLDLHTSLINAYLQKASDADASNNKTEANENYNNAIAAISVARKTDPSNEDLLKTMIDLYIRLGRSDEAKPYIREAITKEPNNKLYQYNIGVLLMQADHTDSLKEAITHFEAALQADPNYEVALQNIAVAHMKIGDRMKKAASEGDAKKNADKTYLEHFKKAAGYFERLTQIKPDDANYWNYLATAYANANMVKKAEEALKKADEKSKK